MINYQLKTGKTIQIPLEYLIDMTDEQLEREMEDIVSRDMGNKDVDVWDNSVLRDGDGKKEKVSIEEIDTDLYENGLDLDTFDED